MLVKTGRLGARMTTRERKRKQLGNLCGATAAAAQAAQHGPSSATREAGADPPQDDWHAHSLAKATQTLKVCVP